MASMYSAKVMEHFANPHNVGEIPDANGVGEVGNPKCGDIMRMYLKIENNVIYRRQGIDPEPIVGKLEEDCDHCESCGE